MNVGEHHERITHRKQRSGIDHDPVEVRISLQKKRIECTPFEQLRRRQSAVEPGEFRFVVEQLQVAWRASHEEENHALGFRGVVWLSRREWIQAGVRCITVLAQQISKSNRA